MLINQFLSWKPQERFLSVSHISEMMKKKLSKDLCLVPVDCHISHRTPHHVAEVRLATGDGRC